MIHALVLAAVTAADAKPLRKLQYSFTYSTPKEQHTGTIHADVLGVSADGGLVVRFSQDVPGVKSQTYPAAACAVFGDTRVQCDGSGSIGTFENELAHLLGRNFVDGNAMDEKNHWQVAGSMTSGSLTDDFTVTSNNAGILNIDEVRDFVVGTSKTHHTATITYDLNKTIPTKLNYSDSSAANPGAAVTVNYVLQSDWIAPPASAKP